MSVIFNTAVATEKRAIVYINGMGTTKDKAEFNKVVVRSSFARLTNTSKVDLVYNVKESILAELTEVAVQFLKQKENLSQRGAWAKFSTEYWLPYKNPITDYAGTAFAALNESNYVNDADLAKLVSKVVGLIKEQYKVVIFSHSQGNFYANRAWDAINQIINETELSKAVGIVGIATPANRVAGNGLYTTNSNDQVINLVRSLGSTQPMPHNATHPYTSDDFTGHGLADIYLSDKVAATNIKSKIVQNVNTMFNRLKTLKPVTCNNFTASVGGGWNGSYLPGNYTGHLNYSMDAYTASNSIRVIAANGAILLNSNGYFSNKKTGQFYYDSSLHGRLSLEVLASSLTSDAWNLSITCPK